MTSDSLGNERAVAPTARRHHPLFARAGLLAVLALTVALASALSPGTASRSGLASPKGPPAPVTPSVKANNGSGSGGGPGDPPANIAPSPNFLNTCTGANFDSSTGCQTATLAAIANARNQEGLPGMVLPTNWAQLSPQQQLFAATNLERTVRGLPPLSAMATALDQASASAAVVDTDPSAPAGFPWSSWGGNWAGAVGSPLEAIYFWMYDDGLGSYNIDCTTGNTSGCWGHRNNILISLRCQPCLMGVGYAATAYRGNPSWTELLVDSSGSSALDFSWSSLLPYLPATPVAPVLAAPAVGIASTPDGQGYWLVASDGGVFAFGTAAFDGSMGGRRLAAPIVGISSTPDGHGYWLVAADGGLFAFGDAGFYGSMGGVTLARKVVGLASTADGRGYWEVAADGGLFAFGDAGFYGSMGGRPITKPVVGMAPTHDGRGYWEVASDGGIFAFGDAPYLGSMGGRPLTKPVVAMAKTPDGAGYWLTASDGGIFAFGDAPFRGSTGAVALQAPIVSMTPSTTAGYWLASSDGGIFSFGVPFHGSMG
ncbi:MAG TPA: hypothetical protein VMU64_01515 [Acidimicrobiales bacterium]|nr:hypothetical protein [Acidimicrobiales bacterium]